MKLSDAILLGLPEIYFTNGRWFHQQKDGTCEGCLVGAALFASGHRGNRLYWEKVFFKNWPWARNWKSSEFDDDVLSYLTNLAEEYANGKITPAQIAELIRTIEPAEEEAPVAAEDPRVLAAK